MFRRYLTTAVLALASVLSTGLALAATDANQASRADLESVKGIGPGLADKILQARSSGNFKDWADLVDRVPGIGPGNAQRFSQAGLTVGGTAYSHLPAGAQIKSKPADAEAAAARKAEKLEKRSKGGDKSEATPQRRKAD